MEPYISKEVQTEEIFPLRRKLNLNTSDIFSTPPSELRKEISHLRGEIIETHEFHDLELKILQEEHNIADSKYDTTIADLQKSLQSAKDVILDSKKEISNLKTLNEELQEQLKEESSKSLVLKEQYECEIAKLQLTLKKKIYEIENLEKDKSDFEHYVQFQRKEYERKVDELRLALEDRCGKNNGDEEKSFNASERKLNYENENSEELNKIRCTYEEEIKKLKDEHNITLKSFESTNANLHQTNESLTEKLREANAIIEELKEQLHIIENETELLRKHMIITKMNDSAGERYGDESEILDSRIAYSCSLSDKLQTDSVRKKFEAYKDDFHLAHKAVRYLSALRSQLEESGSSLNLSNFSSDSFNEDLPSSTVMEDFTEVEISAVNDATVCNDPLALTRDNTLQTPFKTPITTQKNLSRTDFKTPLNSVSKPLRMAIRTPIGSIKKQCPAPGVAESQSNVNETELLQLKTSLAVREKEICEIKDMFMKKMDESEEILTNSLKNISLLDERILKLENISADFKIKKEKLTEENYKIQELLNNNIEEMTEIRRKLVIEITSLNPQLEGTLTDICIPKLLNIFLNSIMESCKKMPEELSQKLLTEIKALNDKNEIYEGKLFEWERENDKLKEINAELISEKDEIKKEMSVREDEIRILRMESSEVQSLRMKVKDLEERLEKTDDTLKTQVYLRENTSKDLQKLQKIFENVEKDNFDLKLKLEQADKTIEDLRINLTRARKDHLCIVTKEELSELKSGDEQLNTLESILEKYKEAELLMRNELDALKSKLAACEIDLTAKTELIETVSIKLEEANKSKLKYEDIISELKEKLRDLEKDNIELKSLECNLKECKDTEKSLSGEIEKLNSKLKLTEVDLREKTELITKITTQIEEARNVKNEDEKTISELRAQEKESWSTIEQMKNESKNLCERVENLNSDLMIYKADIEEKTKVISQLTAEIEKLENEITRLREFESTFEKLKEIECNMSGRMEVLQSRLSLCEANCNEKIESVARLETELEEAKKVKIKDDKVISNLSTQVEEMEREKVKAKELELQIEKSKDMEKVLSEKVEDLSYRLSVSEVALNENLKLVAETNLKLKESESINAENDEVISELKKQLKNLENEKTKVEELQCTLKNLNEIEKMLLKKVEDLSSNLKSTEAEKMELELKYLAEVEEVSKTKAKNEEIMAMLKLKLEEFNSEKAKFEEFEAAMVKLKEKDRIMTERMENLNSRLVVSEEALKEKNGTLEEMWNEIASAKLTKAKNDHTILALQEELDTLRNLQHTRDATYHKQNEKETLIEDLHNKLNELSSEIECLQEKLLQAESNLKFHEEKLIRLEEIESDLMAYTNNFEELKLDCEKMKKLENDFVQVISELERRNKELEDLNNDFVQKQKDYERITEKNENEIKLLQGKLSITEDKLRLNKVESENLLRQMGQMEEEAAEMKKATNELNTEITELREFKSENSTKCLNLENEREILIENLKEVQERKDEMQNVILQIGNRLECPVSGGPTGAIDCLNFVAEKIDKLLLEHNEVENLKQEVKSSKDIINNLQNEIENYNKKVLNESKSEIFVKPKETFLEKMTPLKSTPVTRRCRVDLSPPHKSQRLEKLENLNDLLNGTLQKIITALNIPVNVNFFSVDCYEASETQVMKYIVDFKCNKDEVSKLNESRNEMNITSERYEEMSRTMNELKICLSDVVRYLGLSEEVLSSHEIISQIEKIKREIKTELLERIAVLREDNQHLDDDNNILQRKSKKLIEIINSNKITISALEKSEELLRTEVESLKGELMKYQGKSKINRKNDLFNRKLDRLEELHQSLIDLLKKILTMMEMENVQKLNLFTPRTFDMESRKISDHVNNWMLKKSNEIHELKSKITELDEECESYVKKIKEDSEQIYKYWEKVSTLELEKGKLEEEIKSLKDVQDKLQVVGKGTEWKDEIENVKKENISLKLQISALNDELAQSKKQREELDEECESLALTVKQEGERRSKIWEELKHEIKTLNTCIEKLEGEKNSLESEKKDLLKKLKANEDGKNSQDTKDGLTCNCRKQSKEVKELRSTIVAREMRILELEQLNEKNVVRKMQMKTLENSLSAVKKKLAEENELNQKLQAEIKELSSQKGSQETEILGKLKIRDSGTAAVNQIEEKEKLQKLEKDNRMLKELCRTRYNEIKRLETENLSLKGHERMTKNSNQMDSPIRTRAFSKTLKNY